MSKIIPITIAVIAYFFILLPFSVMIGIPAEISSIVTVIAIVGFIMYNYIKQDNSLHNTLKYQLPFQVLKLVQQAHTNSKFSTDPYIKVSAEMREKLLYPLNPVLASINGSTKYPVTEHEFKYDVVESKYISNDLHVTISINIDYCDTSKHINVHYHDVLMYIVCSPDKEIGLHISSVEHN